MLVPSIFRNDWFDDLWSPAFREMEDTDRKLYGKHASRIMKTDVQEKDDGYVVDIDLPGFKKDEVEIRLEHGYLTVTAEKGLDEKEEDKKGKMICQERYVGARSRSFYVGEDVTEEDVKAKFENGVLQLSIPKKEKLPPVKKTIMIEG